MLVLHRQAARLARDSGLATEFVGSTTRSATDGAAVARSLDCIVSRIRPRTVIHSDVLATANAMWSTAAPGAPLELRWNVPSFTVDVWDLERTGTIVDLAGGRAISLTRMPGSGAALAGHTDAKRLIPVPFANLSAKGARFPGIYACDSAQASSSADPGSAGGRAPMVLLCTGAWQTSQAGDPDCRRIVRAFLQLLALYISRLGGNVRLVHVGPAEPDLRRGLPVDRYVRFPPLPAHALDRLIDEADVFVSPNLSSNTIVRAMSAGVPVVLFQSSLRLDTPADLGPLDGTSREVLDLVRRLLPISPFRVWPIGYFEFLAPVVDDNPFLQAIRVVEMCDEHAALSALTSLLEDPQARIEAAERQAHYLTRVGDLPGIPELMAAGLEQ